MKIEDITIIIIKNLLKSSTSRVENERRKFIVVKISTDHRLIRITCEVIIEQDIRKIIRPRERRLSRPFRSIVVLSKRCIVIWANGRLISLAGYYVAERASDAKHTCIPAARFFEPPLALLLFPRIARLSFRLERECPFPPRVSFLFFLE